jgi:tetratricopeptide (TPR) repeat protein
MRSIRFMSSLAVVASVLAAGPLSAADSLTLVGVKEAVAVKSEDLRIEKGYAYYTEIISNRSKRSQIVRVKSIHIEKIKQLSQGDAAFGKKDYNKAVNLYKSAYGRAKTPWLRLWTGRRLVSAYDKSNQFEKALRLYIDLLAKDSSNYIRSVQPQKAPADKAAMKALVPVVEKALANASGAEHKQHLAKIKEWLGKGGPAPAAASTVASVSATASHRSKLASHLKQMTEAKQYAKALALINKELEQPAAPLAALLYYQGVAQGATGKDMDALVSYMRVIVHFPAIHVYSQPARAEAGKLLVKRKQTQQAKRLWTEGLNSATRTKRAATVKKFKALLKGA